jgi:peptidoglycan hydrolase CwlO-like protein
MGLKLDGLQKRLDSLNEAPEIAKTVDSLKAQNARLSDSLKKLSKDIDVLKKTQ